MEDKGPGSPAGSVPPELPVPSVEPVPQTVAPGHTEIILSPTRGTVVDTDTVAFQFYNSFNYSLLSPEGSVVRLALGITSANAGEGKSLVASNLAVSLTLGYRKKTVLVDLNFRHPTLHTVFGTPQGPGLYEALTNGQIRLWQTAIEHLHLLSVGGIGAQGDGTVGSRRRSSASGGRRRHLDIDQMTAFNDVMSALQREYEFIVVDMPAMNTEDFPVLFANRLNGILMVVDAQRTKRHDVERVFRRLNERQVLGFVLNRFKDDEE